MSRQYEDATLRIKGDLSDLFQMLDALEKRLESISAKFGSLGGGGGGNGANAYTGGAYGGGSGGGGGFDGSRIGDRNLAFTNFLSGGLSGSPSVAAPPSMSPNAQATHSGGGFSGGPPPPGGPPGGGGGPPSPPPSQPPGSGGIPAIPPVPSGDAKQAANMFGWWELGRGVTQFGSTVAGNVAQAQVSGFSNPAAMIPGMISGASTIAGGALIATGIGAPAGVAVMAAGQIIDAAISPSIRDASGASYSDEMAKAFLGTDVISRVGNAGWGYSRNNSSSSAYLQAAMNNSMITPEFFNAVSRDGLVDTAARGRFIETMSGLTNQAQFTRRLGEYQGMMGDDDGLRRIAQDSLRGDNGMGVSQALNALHDEAGAKNAKKRSEEFKKFMGDSEIATEWSGGYQARASAAEITGDSAGYLSQYEAIGGQLSKVASSARENRASAMKRGQNEQDWASAERFAQSAETGALNAKLQGALGAYNIEKALSGANIASTSAEGQAAMLGGADPSKVYATIKEAIESGMKPTTDLIARLSAGGLGGSPQAAGARAELASQQLQAMQTGMAGTMKDYSLTSAGIEISSLGAQTASVGVVGRGSASAGVEASYAPKEAQISAEIAAAEKVKSDLQAQGINDKQMFADIDRQVASLRLGQSKLGMAKEQEGISAAVSSASYPSIESRGAAQRELIGGALGAEGMAAVTAMGQGSRDTLSAANAQIAKYGSSYDAQNPFFAGIRNQQQSAMSDVESNANQAFSVGTQMGLPQQGAMAGSRVAAQGAAVLTGDDEAFHAATQKQLGIVSGEHARVSGLPAPTNDKQRYDQAMTLAGLESQQIGLKQQMGAVIQPPERAMAQSDLSTKMAITQMTFSGEGSVRGMLQEQMKLGRADLSQIQDRMSQTSDPAILAQLNQQKNAKMVEMAGMQQQLEQGWTERLVSQAFNTPGSGKMSMSQFTRRESSMFAGAYAQAFGGTQAQTAQMRNGYKRISSDVGDTPAGNMNRAMAGAQRTPTDFDRVMNSGGGSGGGGGGGSSSPSSHVDSKAAFSDLSGAMEGIGPKLSGAVHGTGSTTIGGGSAGMGAHYLKQLEDTSGDNDIARGVGNQAGVTFEDVAGFVGYDPSMDRQQMRDWGRSGIMPQVGHPNSQGRPQTGESYVDPLTGETQIRGEGSGEAGARRAKEQSDELYRRKARGTVAGFSHSRRQGGISSNNRMEYDYFHGAADEWVHMSMSEADYDNPDINRMPDPRYGREATRKASASSYSMNDAIRGATSGGPTRIEVVVKLQDQQGKELGRGASSTHVNVAHSQKGQTDKGNNIPHR